MKLKERQCLATDSMHLKGKFGLNSVLAKICFTYYFPLNKLAPN